MEGAGLRLCPTNSNVSPWELPRKKRYLKLFRAFSEGACLERATGAGRGHSVDRPLHGSEIPSPKGRHPGRQTKARGGGRSRLWAQGAAAAARAAERRRGGLDLRSKILLDRAPGHSSRMGSWQFARLRRQ